MLEDKINKDTLKIETFNDEILREYDIRGLVGKNLTTNTAYSIGIKFGSIVYKNTKDKKIVVGYDGRPSSKQLQEALCHGLTESGLSVILIGLCPTPMLYFATHTLSASSGVMITGSHNPKDYNGFKIVENKRSLSK